MTANRVEHHVLIETAKMLGGQKTQKAVVTQALQEYIEKRQQLKLTKLFGQIDYDIDYDYKAHRKQGSAGDGDGVGLN